MRRIKLIYLVMAEFIIYQYLLLKSILVIGLVPTNGSRFRSQH